MHELPNNGNSAPTHSTATATEEVAEDLEYAGFWIRVGAALIDTLLLMLLLVPAAGMVLDMNQWQGDIPYFNFWNLLLNYILPAVVVLIFWFYKSATPGKMALKLTIVDADTGAKPTPARFVVRYLGYYLAMLPLFAGIIWVGIDARKQGWHDKLARTVVIRTKPEPVRFKEKP